MPTARHVLATALISLSAPASAAQAGDLELVLAVDVSGRGGGGEQELHPPGRPGGFRDPAVIDAIRALPGAWRLPWWGSPAPHSVAPWSAGGGSPIGRRRRASRTPSPARSRLRSTIATRR